MFCNVDLRSLTFRWIKVTHWFKLPKLGENSKPYWDLFVIRCMRVVGQSTEAAKGNLRSGRKQHVEKTELDRMPVQIAFSVFHNLCGKNECGYFTTWYRVSTNRSPPNNITFIMLYRQKVSHRQISRNLAAFRFRTKEIQMKGNNTWE